MNRTQKENLMLSQSRGLPILFASLVFCCFSSTASAQGANGVLRPANERKSAPQIGIEQMPDTFLIDREGRIAATYVGMVDRSGIEKKIRTCWPTVIRSTTAGNEQEQSQLSLCQYSRQQVRPESIPEGHAHPHTEQH